MSKVCFLSAIYAFASTSNLIRYFRGRYEHRLVRDLNYVLRLKGKCVRSREEIRFLKECLQQRVVPVVIKSRVRRGKPKEPWDIEKAFLRDEVDKTGDVIERVTGDYRRKLADVLCRLSFVDRIRFCKLINRTALRLLHRTRTKKDKTLYWLRKTQLGLGQVDHSTITNLSSIELSEVQKDVLCRGLNFGIPPKLRKEEIKAEFEMCWNQAKDLPAFSEDRRDECKSTLSSLAHKYANASVDKSGFPFDSEHLAALKDLRRNEDIIISKPDKGNGVVILDKSDYVEKMNDILSQADKFVCIGDVETNDNTLLRERALQAFLLRHKKARYISQEVYERIRPVGCSRPRMYGLPKIHKASAPLRPILSMTNAPQHQLAKWLAEVLQPVVMKYSEHTVRDSFEFCANIDECAVHHDVTNTYMCSFDVTSLFTNIPLKTTLRICLDALYRDENIVPPSMPEKEFEKLLLKATTDVEFSFNGMMYKQIDGVAMGSPLGPVLANIFVGHCESQVDQDKWPLFYNRFVDDTFAVFLSQRESEDFFQLLNGLHPSLRFTVEGERDGLLPFMDVLVKRIDNCLIRSVYRKPTFTGLYTRWDSFAPTNQKINLVKSLTSRSVRICSPSTLSDEVAKLKEIFLKNGYPSQLVERLIKRTIERGKGPPVVTEAAQVDEHFVHIRLPWIGQRSTDFRRDLHHAVQRGFPSAVLRVIFTTARAFSGKAKDVLPDTSKSSIIYEYRCRCERAYIGKTVQRLSERIRQHIPNKLLETPPVLRGAKTDSAITRHLKEHPECIAEGLRSRFRIVARGRSQTHLDVLEALYIQSLSPALCCQKDFVRVLSLF